MAWQDKVTDLTVVAHASCKCGIKDLTKGDVDHLIANPNVKFSCLACRVRFGLKEIFSNVIVIEEEW